MRFFKSFILPLTACLSFFTSQAYEVIPADPTVRTGKLPNGLTYYVKQNNYPEHRADFFIAQKVGSIQEEEHQRGLAHFLEHMCFNGTKHFPGNSLISYMESVGVKFGANLNAYTSTDETVYNISNVPTAQRSVLDTCFLVLADWSCNLLLNNKDIDEERGVIEGEYRHRSGANYRLLEKSSDALYPGCLYGKRMPIGLMSVVKNFKYKDLKDYYKKWYHPGNQAIIVVGDIDPEYAVAKITELFADFKTPKNATPVVPVQVPENENIISTVQTDPEQGTTSVRLLFKHNDISCQDMATTKFLENDYLKHLVCRMLSARFDELKQKPEAPVITVGVSDRDYMISKTQQAFQIIATAKPGRANDAMKFISTEVHRARIHGFTESEMRRARLNYEASLDKFYRERDKYTNTAYCRDFVRAFIDGEPFPDIETAFNLSLKVINNVGLDQVNNYFQSIISPTNRNVVLVTFAPEGQDIPTEQSLAEAFREGREQQVTAWVDEVKSGKLLNEEPTPGTIVAETPLNRFGAKVWTLSNGAKVYLKKTEFSPDEVTVNAAGPGGLSQNYTAVNAPSFKAIGGVVAASAFGEFNQTDLKKVLAGHNVAVRPFVSKTEEGFAGRTTPRDLETEFQLIYLKLTSIQKDENAFNQFLETNRTRLSNQTDPKFEFADSIFSNVFNRHPLGAEKLTKDEVEHVNYDVIIDCYRDRMADVSDWNFYIVGNYDEDSLRNLTERYLAALPGNGRIEQPKDIGYRLFDRKIDNRWTRKMENQQDKVYYFWTDTATYNLRNQLIAQITGQIFNNIFREEIREKRAWTYHVDTHCSIVTDHNGNDAPIIYFPLNVTLKAGTAEECRQIIEQTIAQVASDGISTEQLDKVKQYLRKVHDEDVVDNSYWMAMMKAYAKFEIDFNADYMTTLNSITTDDIRTFVDLHMARNPRLNLTMTAQE